MTSPTDDSIEELLRELARHRNDPVAERDTRFLVDLVSGVTSQFPAPTPAPANPNLINNLAREMQWRIDFEADRIRQYEARMTARAENLINKAETLEIMGYLSEEEAAAVKSTGEELLKMLKEAKPKLTEAVHRWNTNFHDFFTALHTETGDFFKRALQDEKTKFDTLVKEQKPITDAAEENLKYANQRKIDAMEKVREHPEDAAAKRELEDATKAEKQAASMALAEKEKLESYTQRLEQIGEEITHSWKASALSLAEKGMIMAGTDVAKLWKSIGAISDQINVAMDHITIGYTRYLKEVSGQLEFDSALWKEARQTTRGIAKREAARVEKEIAHLTELAETGQKEEFLVAASKYMAPSTRMFLMIGEDFKALQEGELAKTWMVFLDVRYLFGLVKDMARASVMTGLKVGEVILGEQVVEGISRLVMEAGLAAGVVLEKLLSIEVQIGIMAAELLNDFRMHGFSWKFLDDFLGFLFLSLEDFSPALKLKEYPKFSKQVSTKLDKGNPVNMLKYQNEEFAIVLDYWGKQYIEAANHMLGKKYPEYQKLKRFHAIKRVPGLYIDPKNHPLDTDTELEECLSIERKLDANHFVGDHYVAPSLVNQYLPKQPGLVRNLASFPMYQKTFQWIDSDKGLEVQLSGNFSKSDVDPTIQTLFMYWLDSGKWGVAYNSAKTREAQIAAENANKADYAQWVLMNPTWYMARQELDAWVQSARGAQGIGVDDMILLAPDNFEREWTKDLPKGYFITFGSKFEWPESKYQYDLYYEASAQHLGRHTYHPKDRKFLEDAVKGKIMTGEIVFPGAIPPFNCLERLDWVAKDGSVVVICIYQRDAWAGEKETYQKILDQGNKYRAELAERKRMTQEEWDKKVMDRIWKSYVTSEKPFRTPWGYINKYKTFFMQELMYVTSWLNGKRSSKLWTDYIKYLRGKHIPLQMDSSYRVLMMGSFAQAAYSNNKSINDQFEKLISRKFGKILENDLVTTHGLHGKPGWPWAKHINNFIHSDAKVDWPVFFGDLNCRMIVVEKPLSVIVAFKGTSSVGEWAIDMDFSIADYIRMGEMKDGLVHYTTDSKQGGTSWDVLEKDPNRFKVHRGFLRAFESLRPYVTARLLEYYKKYPLIEEMFITGHSLGAALTQLAGIMLPRVPYRQKVTSFFPGETKFVKWKNPHCYMFASPLVGDTRFQSHFDDSVGEAVQVWNDGDAIVSVPPILIPARDVTHSGYQKVIQVLQTLGEEDKAWGGILFAVREFFEKTSLDSWEAISSIFSDEGSFTKQSVAKGAVKLAIVAGKHRPKRGGQVFMRLEKYGGDATFEETTDDTGNSKWIYENVGKAMFGKKDLAKLHSMGEIISRYAEVVTRNPDLFELDTKDWPPWADHGIHPKKKKRGKDVPEEIIDALIDGRAEIIGYAHAKHHHRAWSVVPKSDVDHETAVFGAETPYMSFVQQHANSKKRYKRDKSDHTYRGADYF